MCECATNAIGKAARPWVPQYGTKLPFFWLNREVDGQAAVLQNFDDGILQPVIAQQLLGMPRFKMEPQRSRKPLERASTMNEDIGDGVKE